MSAYQVCIQIVVLPGDQDNACLCNHWWFFLGIIVLHYSSPAWVILRPVCFTESMSLCLPKRGKTQQIVQNNTQNLNVSHSFLISVHFWNVPLPLSPWRQAAQKRCTISVPRGLQDPTGQNLKQCGVNWVLTHICAGGWTVALPRAIPMGRIHWLPRKSQCGTKHSAICYLLCFQGC